MKALLYTIILTALLLAAVLFLRSIQRPETIALDPLETTELGVPMVVQSEPAPLSNIDPAELKKVNQTALYDTALELLDLWRLPEAIDVFETLVGQDPTHIDGYLRLVESYSHPIIGLEKRAEECWQKARKLTLDSGLDTTRVSAFRSLFVDYLPSSAIDQLRVVMDRDGEDVNARFLLAQPLADVVLRIVDAGFGGSGGHLGHVLDRRPTFATDTVIDADLELQRTNLHTVAVLYFLFHRNALAVHQRAVVAASHIRRVPLRRPLALKIGRG